MKDFNQLAQTIHEAKSALDCYRLPDFILALEIAVLHMTAEEKRVFRERYIRMIEDVCFLAALSDEVRRITKGKEVT